jgi:hypothetical protein
VYEVIKFGFIVAHILWQFLSLFTSGSWLLLLVLASAAWVARDSAKMELRRYESVLSCHPLILFVLCSGLWPIVLPWYLWIKRRIALGREKTREAISESGTKRVIASFALVFCAVLNLVQNQPTPMAGQEWKVGRAGPFPFRAPPTLDSENLPLLPDAQTTTSGNTNNTYPKVHPKDKVLVLQRDLLLLGGSPLVKVKVLEGASKGAIGYIYEWELGPRIGDHISAFFWTIAHSTFGEDFNFNH